jgi:FkbM family methyltransferase
MAVSRIAGLVHRIPAPPVIRRSFQARRRRRFEARLAGPRLLRAFGQAFPRARFVEIGANDGIQHDHLRLMIQELEWQGVMVEPVPYVFERLRAAYQDNDRVTLENAAIADRNDRLPFYHLAKAADYEREGLPQWYDGIGSFSRKAVLSHVKAIPDIPTRLVETEVPALTFDALCAKHGLASIDLVLIDAESYDHVILGDIDFGCYRPALVVYEHYHLATNDRSACSELMRGHGYETLEEGFDTWCLRLDADPLLTRTWHATWPGAPGLYAEDEEA